MHKLIYYIFFVVAFATSILHASMLGDKMEDFSSDVLVYPFYPRTVKGSVYHDLSMDKLCTVGYTKTVRCVSVATRRAVFSAYGVTRGHWGEYEVDHFISLELGGNNSLDNLFPQPYELYLSVHGHDIRMGAREKDVVEHNLHKRVCKGEITLKQAQEMISKNWVGYYLKLKHRIK